MQLCIIFLDAEGEPTQELSAIVMSVADRHIVDIYHAHAQTTCPDDWARRHVHGLNKLYLEQHGFSNEEALIADFRKWLRGRDVLCMYANNPIKERSLFKNLVIYDIQFPRWQERVSLASHQTAYHFKRLSTPITSLTGFKSCSKDTHDEFKFVPTPRESPTELAKRDFGYHCALYDCYALYLFYVCSS